MDLITLVHNHFILNDESILLNINSDNYDQYELISFNLPIYVEINDGYLCINNVEYGIEYKIPYTMIVSLLNLNANECIKSKGYSPKSKYEELLVILHSISNNFRNSMFIKDTGFRLLKLIDRNSLSTKELRDDMYSYLGIVSGYITYSTPDYFEFY